MTRYHIQNVPLAWNWIWLIVTAPLYIIVEHMLPLRDMTWLIDFSYSMVSYEKFFKWQTVSMAVDKIDI